MVCRADQEREREAGRQAREEAAVERRIWEQERGVLAGEIGKWQEESERLQRELAEESQRVERELG
jgi:hypothetical protein